MVRTSPSNAGSVDSITGGKAKIPQASGPKNSNSKQKQYCNKFSKDFKNGSHPKKKKKILQKEKVCLLKYLHKHTFSVQYGNYQITVGLEESHEAVATLLKCCVDTGECKKRWPAAPCSGRGRDSGRPSQPRPTALRFCWAGYRWCPSTGLSRGGVGVQEDRRRRPGRV